MTATVAGIHLGIDTHANRPVANTVPDGSIYSCSTHGLVYKSNNAGNSWATWATLGAAAAAFIGARAYNAGQQTVSAATETTALFDTDEYDTSAIHDTSSNTGRETVPTGMGGYWRFTPHFWVAGSHGLVYAYLRKNGTTPVIGSEIDVATATTDFGGTWSVTIALAAGDYIELRGYRATGTTFGGTSDATRCSMEAEFLGV